MRALLLGLFLSLGVSSASAQDTSSAITVDTAARRATLLVDTTARPPISPRRAALLSLAIPGYGQSRLGRNNGAMVFALAEVAFIGMARKAAIDLREAKIARKDSVLINYLND